MQPHNYTESAVKQYNQFFNVEIEIKQQVQLTKIVVDDHLSYECWAGPLIPNYIKAFCI